MGGPTYYTASWFAGGASSFTCMLAGISACISFRASIYRDLIRLVQTCTHCSSNLLISSSRVRSWRASLRKSPAMAETCSNPASNSLPDQVRLGRLSIKGTGASAKATIGLHLKRLGPLHHQPYKKLAPPGTRQSNPHVCFPGVHAVSALSGSLHVGHTGRALKTARPKESGNDEHGLNSDIRHSFVAFGVSLKGVKMTKKEHNKVIIANGLERFGNGLGTVRERFGNGLGGRTGFERVSKR